jgi:hypothetical protein
MIGVTCIRLKIIDNNNNSLNIKKKKYPIMKNQFNKNNEKMKEKKLLSFPFFLGRISSFYFDTSFLIFKTKKGT